MIVAIVGIKGGVGKSTLAISLAHLLHGLGNKVLLMDTDTMNQTAQRCAATAQARRVSFPHTVSVDPRYLKRQKLAPLFRAHDYTIIDGAGRAGADLTAPIMFADVALFPSAPTTADAGVFETQLEAARPILKARNVRAAVVLTKLLPRTSIAKLSAARKVYEATGLYVFQARTFTRIAWQRCLDMGQGVAQYSPKSEAAWELKRVLRELMQVALSE